MKRLIAIPVVLGILIVLAGGILWLQRLAREQHSFSLSNGAVVTFRQATFGTNHTVSTARSWHRFVPKLFARWLKTPMASSSFTTTSPAVVLWFENTRTPGGGPSYAYSLVHADGTETAFDESHFYASYSPTNSLEGTPSAYPQREKTLRIRFYDRVSYDDVVPLGEFTIRNPQVSRAPRTSAPPLPQTARDSDLEITLTSLETGARRGRWEKTNVLNQWTQARFQVRDHGALSTNWTVQRMEATDSTGIRLVSYTWSGGTEKKLQKFECRPVLWPSETYKLRFEFSRKPEAVFETNELWTIRGVAVPTNGGFTLVNTQINRSGFNVRFHGLTTPQALAPWNKMIGGEPSLGFSVSQALKDYRFTLLRVTDDQGKTVETTGFGSSDTNWGLGLRLEDEMKSIDVTVALHRSRFVEFQAQPAKWDGKFSR